MNLDLPTEPNAGLLNGIWFVFPDGDRTIRLWGSTLSGKEKIYVDGELVQESRSLRTKATHEFNIDSDVYRTEFSVTLRGRTTCVLYKNGAQIAQQTFDYQGSRFVKLWVLIIVSGALGFLAAVYELLPSSLGAYFGLFSIVVLAIIAFEMTNAKIVLIDRE